MDKETKAGDMESMHGEMHGEWKEKMKKWHSRSWSEWKSPVGLGFFLLTASLALAIFLYTALNFVVSIEGVLHPADSQAAMSAQEQQALEQEMQQPAPTTDTTGTPAQ